MMTQIIVIGLHLRWVRALAASRKRPRAKPGWAMVLLAWTCCTVTATAAPTFSSYPTGWVPSQAPRQSDLELWSSGQLTIAEQLAREAQRLALDRPLSSGGRVPPELRPSDPPVFPPQPPEEIQPLPEEIEDLDWHWRDDEGEATTHISFRLFSPFFESESVDIGMSFTIGCRESPRVCARISQIDY